MSSDHLLARQLARAVDAMIVAEHALDPLAPFHHLPERTRMNQLPPSAAAGRPLPDRAMLVGTTRSTPSYGVNEPPAPARPPPTSARGEMVALHGELNALLSSARILHRFPDSLAGHRVCAATSTELTKQLSPEELDSLQLLRSLRTLADEVATEIQQVHRRLDENW